MLIYFFVNLRVSRAHLSSSNLVCRSFRQIRRCICSDRRCRRCWICCSPCLRYTSLLGAESPPWLSLGLDGKQQLILKIRIFLYNRKYTSGEIWILIRTMLEILLEVDRDGFLALLVGRVVASVGLRHHQVPRRLGQRRYRGRWLSVVHRRREPLHREVRVCHGIFCKKERSVVEKRTLFNRIESCIYQRGFLFCNFFIVEL